ncbi:MAG: hypothetical protein CUN55_04430 [Phototrophicales bacterium]|nr:MAG: hypothetical protein CUN55_04430 [Phototrophicales bacterium]
MLNEQSNRDFSYEPKSSSPFSKANPLEPEKPLVPQPVHASIEQVLTISRIQRPNVNMSGHERLVAQYVGRLTMPSAQAFELVDPVLEKYGLFAQFSTLDGIDDHVITIFNNRPQPKPRPWWPNAVLFVLTIFSLLTVGAGIQAGIEDREINELTDLRLWEGLPYAISLMLILGAHELGHYFAARYHKVAVTLPYFIPLPFIGIFGTMGAFIQIRDNVKNRKALFDIGVSGPLAGLIFAIPILFIGLATSNIEPIPTDQDIIREGNSIFYAVAKYITFGEFLPNGNRDVFINQLAQAGWTGLFVTALNLVPVGQLDGGHVMYTLLGRRARVLYWPIIIGLVILSLMNSAWIIWLLLLFLFGRFYAQPLDDITPLDPMRRTIGILVLVIFVLIFIPNPIEFIPAAN